MSRQRTRKNRGFVLKSSSPLPPLPSGKWRKEPIASSFNRSFSEETAKMFEEEYKRDTVIRKEYDPFASKFRYKVYVQDK